MIFVFDTMLNCGVFFLIVIISVNRIKFMYAFTNRCSCSIKPHIVVLPKRKHFSSLSFFYLVETAEHNKSKLSTLVANKITNSLSLYSASEYVRLFFFFFNSLSFAYTHTQVLVSFNIIVVILCFSVFLCFI